MNFELPAGAALVWLETPYRSAGALGRQWLLAADRTGVLRLTCPLSMRVSTSEELARLSLSVEACRAASDPAAQAKCREISEALAAWWLGDAEALSRATVTFSERLGGTAFEKRVWAGARRVPAGGRTSYGEIAAAIGAPQASQAVGNALRRNPVLLLTPCHRVLPAAALRRTGLERVGGFSGELDGPLTDLKREMLLWEAERFGSSVKVFRLEEDQPALF